MRSADPLPFVGARRYAQYRAEREQAHKDWLQRKKEREEKLARGEDVGPEEPDPTEEVEVGCLGLLKFILYATLFIILAGKFFTGSFLWEHELPNLRQFIPVRVLSYRNIPRPLFSRISDESASEGRWRVTVLTSHCMRIWVLMCVCAIVHDWTHADESAAFLRNSPRAVRRHGP